MRLHTTIGPAHTTISAVAEEAGVTRVTVYRHFADEEQLFAACSGHWMSLHPPPAVEAWLPVPPVEPRARHALGELYRWYRDNGNDLFRFYRDADAMPPGVQEQMRGGEEQMAQALIEGSGVRGAARRRLRASAGHVVSFPTWWSLAVEQELADPEVLDTAVGYLLSAVPGTS